HLDAPEVRTKLLSFASETYARVTFYIPAIHCVSCIWLLENLHKIEPGIVRTEVVFGEKRVTIDFNPQRVALSGVAKVLSTLGYVPEISRENKPRRTTDRSLVLKIA